MTLSHDPSRLNKDTFKEARLSFENRDYPENDRPTRQTLLEAKKDIVDKNKGRVEAIKNNLHRL